MLPEDKSYLHLWADVTTTQEHLLKRWLYLAISGPPKSHENIITKVIYVIYTQEINT